MTAQVLRSSEYFPTGEDRITVERCWPQGAFPEHTHDFQEIAIVQAGRGTHVMNDRPTRIGPGSVLILRPQQDFHSFENVEALQLSNLHFRNDIRVGQTSLLDTCLDSRAGAPLQIGRNTLKRLGAILVELETLGSRTPAHRIMREGLLLQALGLLVQGIYREETHSDVDERTRQLLIFLRENFQENIDWQELSERFHLPARTLRRKVREHTGCSPQEFLTRLRLQNACLLLRTTATSITQIAYDCGFEDSNNFSTLFRRFYERSPRAYRKDNPFGAESLPQALVAPVQDNLPST